MEYRNRTQVLTKDGLDSLKKRLDDLTNQRKTLYTSFKEDLDLYDNNNNRFTESHLKAFELLDVESIKISNILKYAKTIVKVEHPEMIELGTVATIRNNELVFDVTVVSPIEVNMDTYMISEKSPLGIALLNKRVGELIELINLRGKSHVYEVIALK